MSTPSPRPERSARQDRPADRATPRPHPAARARLIADRGAPGDASGELGAPPDMADGELPILGSGDTWSSNDALGGGAVPGAPSGSPEAGTGGS